MNHPLAGKIDDYTTGQVGHKFTHESDRPGHGAYRSFKDPIEGNSRNFQALTDWQDFASANSYHGPERQSAHPDQRKLHPSGRDMTGKGKE